VAELTDFEVIDKVLGGDVDAFEILVNRWQNQIFQIASRHVPPQDVEDLAHEVFMDAYKSLGKFKRKSPFEHWLKSIALRKARDYWRRIYRSGDKPVSCLNENHSEWADRIFTAESIEAFKRETEQREARDLLEWALFSLSPDDRMALALIHFEGCSIKETAQLMGWSVASAKVRSHRSKAKLKKRLESFMREP